jgi:putative hydrolase of the HAD superfamily
MWAGTLPARLRIGVMPAIRAVFFDAADTLIGSRHGFGTVYSRVTANYNMRIPAAIFDQELGRAMNTLDIPLRTSPDIEYRRWEEVSRKIAEALPGDLPFKPWFNALYRAFAEASAWEPVPGAADTLAALRAQGVATGCISNWDDRLPGVLHGLGLMRDLDHVLVAPQVGWRKPAPEIFRSACVAAQVSPHEALHIGDSASEDVAGARAAGLHALRFDPADPTALRRLLDLLHHPLLLRHDAVAAGE